MLIESAITEQFFSFSILVSKNSMLNSESRLIDFILNLLEILDLN